MHQSQVDFTPTLDTSRHMDLSTYPTHRSQGVAGPTTEWNLYHYLLHST